MDPLERKQKEETRLNTAIETQKKELADLIGTFNSAQQKADSSLESIKTVVKESSDILMSFLQDKKKEEERLDRAILNKTQELAQLVQLVKDMRGMTDSMIGELEKRFNKIKSL